MSPLHGQARRKVANCSFRGVVRRLGLGDVDDCAGHGADHDHAAWGFTLHQVTRDSGREKVCSINIDAPELLDAVERVCDGIEVLGEARGGDQVVNLAMVLDNRLNCCIDRVGVGDVRIVGGDLGNARKRSALRLGQSR